MLNNRNKTLLENEITDTFLMEKYKTYILLLTSEINVFTYITYLILCIVPKEADNLSFEFLQKQRKYAFLFDQISSWNRDSYLKQLTATST